MTLKIPVGLDINDVPRLPDDVANGLACECVCPGCRGALIAVNQGLRQVSHFRHHVEVDCRLGFESALHLLGKMIVAEELGLWLPCLEVSYAGEGERNIHNYVLPLERLVRPAGKVSFIDVEQEVTIGSIRPDLLGRGETETLAIEIEVTNPVNDAKAAIFTQMRQAAVAIDLSSLLVERVDDLVAVVQARVRSGSHTRWVYSPDAEVARLALIEEWRRAEAREAERLEAERLEAERIEAERLEAERIAAQAAQALADEFERDAHDFDDLAPAMAAGAGEAEISDQVARILSRNLIEMIRFANEDPRDGRRAAGVNALAKQIARLYGLVPGASIEDVQAKLKEASA